MRLRTLRISATAAQYVTEVAVRDWLNSQLGKGNWYSDGIDVDKCYVFRALPQADLAFWYAH